MNDPRYRRQIGMIHDFLDEVMGAQAVGNIDIIRIWKHGWYAWVAVTGTLGQRYLNLKEVPTALMIGYKKGYMRVIDISKCRGFDSEQRPILEEIDAKKNVRLLKAFFDDPYYHGSYYHTPLVP